MSLPVLTDPVPIVALTVDCDGSRRVTTHPSTSLNVPRTRLIRCRTAKPTVVCAGSITQVPAAHPAGIGAVSAFVPWIAVAIGFTTAVMEYLFTVVVPSRQLWKRAPGRAILLVPAKSSGPVPLKGAALVPLKRCGP
jgi:hypothetical protein